MNSETLCEICHQILSSPTILTCCYASVCLECLKKISVREMKSFLSYKCPVCNKENQSYSSCKPNTFLARYIEYGFKNGRFQNLKCNNCQTAVQYMDMSSCNECGNKYFCKECNNNIHNQSSYKNHVRLSLNNTMKNFAGSLSKSMFCPMHFREKIEFICLKDLNTLCKSCVTSHKRNCKEHKITSFEKAHLELASQLTKKLEQVNNYRNMADGEYLNIQQKLEQFNSTSEKMMNSIESYFENLRAILDLKEKEVKASMEKLFNQRKSILTKEIQSLENMNFKTECFIDVVEFAMSYPNSFFCEGAKYLVHRLNRLNCSAPKVESARQTQIPDLDLANFENCKAALSRLSLQEIVRTPLQNNFFPRSKSGILREDAFLTLEKSPLSPRIENYSIIQDAKRRHSQLKSSTISASRVDLFSPQKGSPTPEIKTLATQRSFTQFPVKAGSYKDLLLKLSRPKDQKENVSEKVETPNPPKVSKAPLQSLISSVGSSRRPSKSPIFKHSSFKSWTESSKLRTAVSDELGWTLCLSKDENIMTEEELQMLADIQRNPLVKRKFIKTSQTANSIYVSWSHSPDVNNLIYQLDYGVGSKVQNVEQFRTAYKGPSNSYIISGLMPKTRYRLRVCPMIYKEITTETDTSSTRSSKEPKEQTIGLWSDITNVLTKDLQTIDNLSIGTHATVGVQGKETVVDFEKSGKVFARNEYEFGKTSWEIKIPQHIAHQSPVDSNSFIKVGVTNKNGKAHNIVGGLINYGLSTDAMIIKVFLDLDNKSMTIYNLNTKYKEVINNLPAGPLYPVFQNKTSKDSNFPLKLIIKFDLPYTSNDLKDLDN